MSISILVAPAAAGKTAYVVDLVREASARLRATPLVIVATGLQRHAFQRRLARAGGAIGVRVNTFGKLYASILQLAGDGCAQLSEPVEYRLIRDVVENITLGHYAPIRDRPGLVQALRGMIGELKAARVRPQMLADALSALNSEPRLSELAHIYGAYQERLHAEGWADAAGMGRLAVEAMRTWSFDAARCWSLVCVDGFDSFTPTQLELLGALALNYATENEGQFVVTLTGDVRGVSTGSRRSIAYQRFVRSRKLLEETLGVQATPLGDQRDHLARPLRHLERRLFTPAAARVEAAGQVELIAAPDRESEARTALRWLKDRLVVDGMQPSEVGLLARDVAPYRHFITQVAREFGLPVRFVDGLPLATNPVVAALLDLLRLMLPADVPNGGPAMPWRLVVDAWRSPYFDWSGPATEGSDEAIGILPGDAEALGTVARWGRVLGGLAQWREAFAALATAEKGVDRDDDAPARLPIGPDACALWGKFGRFVDWVSPPDGALSYREFVRWLEDLIGPDPALASAHARPSDQTRTLSVVSQVRLVPGELEARDVAALQAVKDILRAMVWSDEVFRRGPVTFARFFDELRGATDAALYRIPVNEQLDQILVADVVETRGVPFRAIAIVGLAEGEFPATIHEDSLLHDLDRQGLRDDAGFLLEPSTESAEAGFFYEAIARGREQLLLTRPRIADDGAPWQPSPYWDETCRLIDTEPLVLTSEASVDPTAAASWPEVMELLAGPQDRRPLRDWIATQCPGRLVALDEAVEILRIRSTDSVASPFDGSLMSLSSELERRFAPECTWSASRLENYRTCPFLFFVGGVLGLEPRADPSTGLEGKQLGNVYHRILELVYQAVSDPTSLEALGAALPSVAGEVLDRAPGDQGFRETAWWEHTKTEIVAAVSASIEGLGSIQGTYAPALFEARFGLSSKPRLIIRDGDDWFAVRGLIDRVDLDPAGRVRVIDYKTSGRSAFTNRSVAEGKRLQVPLYALAAQDALGLGEVADGFYWHVRQAERSTFTLSGYEGGPRAAMAAAVAHAWDAVRSARRGEFSPQPPDGGCPGWCPASAFCWHRESRQRA